MFYVHADAKQRFNQLKCSNDEALETDVVSAMIVMTVQHIWQFKHTHVRFTCTMNRNWAAKQKCFVLNVRRICFPDNAFVL